MAATAAGLDEESWLYGVNYSADSKDVDGIAAKAGDDKGSGSPLLDDLDDVIVNSGMKQQSRPSKIVSVSSSLQPKGATPSDEAKTPLAEQDGVFDSKDREEESQESQAGEGEGEEEEEEEDSESDDDVQIHIGPIETQPAPFYQGRLGSTSTALTAPKKVDVDAVPTVGGQPIFELDLDSADKPWRQPGADITDYFNYGFTEETWRLYCDKQRRTKAEVAQLNKIAVHTTRIGTLGKSDAITTIPSLAGTAGLPPPPIHPFPLPPAGLPLPPTLLPPPPLPHLLPPILPEVPSSQESSTAAHTEQDDGGKTPEPGDEKEEGSEGRQTPGVDQDTQDMLPPTGKVPLLPPPPTSLAPPTLSMPPIRTSSSAAPDAANAMAMAAMFRGLHPPDGSFPNFLPPPGFPPFHPQLPGGEFRPRMPPFHGGPPPFPLLPGGPLDVPGMLPPPLDDRGLPLPPELAATWDHSMGPPPPELFEMMSRGREDYSRGEGSRSRSPHSGSSGRSRSRSRSSSYDERRGGRRKKERGRRHSRSRSPSRERDRHARSSRRSHRSSHHRSERHERDRERDRERERERERDRRRREERSRRERSRRHRSSSRDREEDRSSAGGGGRGTMRDRKAKDGPPRDERSHSHTPT